MLTVAKLIEFLQTQPQDILVTFRACSEQCLLELDDMYIGEGCKPRPDGWVQDKRPDMVAQQYLHFPGN
jgi:hypothetical protein